MLPYFSIFNPPCILTSMTLQILKSQNSTSFLTTLITIVVTRISLLLAWNSAVMHNQLSDGWHHMYTGAIIVAISRIIPQQYKYVVEGIGIGLFLDEIIHVPHLLGLTNGTDYWSLQAWISLFLGVLSYWAFLNWRNKGTFLK